MREILTNSVWGSDSQNGYKTPMAQLKAKAKALKETEREPQGYMLQAEMCDDIWCTLCYKFKNERSIWNR